MIKILLSWVSDICDLLGKLLENLAKYPGMGFLNPLANLFGSWAEVYPRYMQQLEWKKQGLETSKERFGELAGRAVPTPKKAGEEAEVEADGVAGAEQLQNGVRASSAPVAGTPNRSSENAPRQGDFRGTIMFDSTVVEQAPDTGTATGRNMGDTAPPSSEKPAYYGTLDGPGQSLSRDLELAPPDYAPAASGDYAPAASSDYDLAASGGAGAARSVPAVVSRPPTSSVIRPEVAAPVPAAMTEEEAAIAWSIHQAGASLVEEDQPSLIPAVDREEQLARLEYLSYRLREAREPLCGLNGALVLVPLAMMRDGTREHFELPRAIQGDLLTLQETLGLRFPTSALLVGLEEHRGFEELVRRIGARRAGSQRLGHRFDLRLAAVPNQLAALCVRLTGVFEDWVYAIFREHGSVARPGNSHLFGMLCQVRTDLQPRLLRILSRGLGRDREEAPGELPLGFSGCYFAATGRTEDRQAFVRGVFDKLTEEQSQVEWLPETRAAARRYRVLGWLGLLVAAGFLAWLAIALGTQP